jgi:putative ABC transport system substrate-binding protein
MRDNLAFREGLQKLGWVENRNMRIDYRWATSDDSDSIERFAKELVALQPDLILSHNTPTSGNAATNTRHPHYFRAY